MKLTVNLSIPYPSLDDAPWYDTFEDMAQGFDLAIFAVSELYRNRTTMSIEARTAIAPNSFVVTLSEGDDTGDNPTGVQAGPTTYFENGKASLLRLTAAMSDHKIIAGVEGAHEGALAVPVGASFDTTHGPLVKVKNASAEHSMPRQRVLVNADGYGVPWRAGRAPLKPCVPGNFIWPVEETEYDSAVYPIDFTSPDYEHSRIDYYVGHSIDNDSIVEGTITVNHTIGNGTLRLHGLDAGSNVVYEDFVFDNAGPAAVSVVSVRADWIKVLGVAWRGRSFVGDATFDPTSAITKDDLVSFYLENAGSPITDIIALRRGGIVPDGAGEYEVDNRSKIFAGGVECYDPEFCFAQKPDVEAMYPSLFAIAPETLSADKGEVYFIAENVLGGAIEFSAVVEEEISCTPTTIISCLDALEPRIDSYKMSRRLPLTAAEIEDFEGSLLYGLTLNDPTAKYLNRVLWGGIGADFQPGRAVLLPTFTVAGIWLERVAPGESGYVMMDNKKADYRDMVKTTLEVWPEQLWELVETWTQLLSLAGYAGAFAEPVALVLGLMWYAGYMGIFEKGESEAIPDLPAHWELPPPEGDYHEVTFNNEYPDPATSPVIVWNTGYDTCYPFPGGYLVMRFWYDAADYGNADVMDGVAVYGPYADSGEIPATFTAYVPRNGHTTVTFDMVYSATGVWVDPPDRYTSLFETASDITPSAQYLSQVACDIVALDASIAPGAGLRELQVDWDFVAFPPTGADPGYLSLLVFSCSSLEVYDPTLFATFPQGAPPVGVYAVTYDPDTWHFPGTATGTLNCTTPESIEHYRLCPLHDMFFVVLAWWTATEDPIPAYIAMSEQRWEPTGNALEITFAEFVPFGV